MLKHSLTRSLAVLTPEERKAKELNDMRIRKVPLTQPDPSLTLDPTRTDSFT